jgi:hypothetical protein
MLKSLLAAGNKCISFHFISNSNIRIPISGQEFNTNVEMSKHFSSKQVKNSILIAHRNFDFDRRNQNRNSDYVR